MTDDDFLSALDSRGIACDPVVALEIKAVLMEGDLAGAIAYALTKRLVIDMPTARAAVDEAMRNAEGQQ